MTSPEPALFGEHVLEHWLESGPDGTRYAARDRDGREVELWTLDSRWLRLHTGRLARLRRIEHASLLRIFEVGEDQLVVERTAGGWEDATLRPGSLAELTSATKGLALALAEAHELGVVHGSLSMSHVTLTAAGAAVLDLIGARVRAEGEDVAPELGGDAVPTGAADVWSLGGILRTALRALPSEGTERLVAVIEAMQRDDPEARPLARSVAEQLEVTRAARPASDAIETALPDGIPNVLGPYAIDEQIGSGGMGRVFRAHDVATGDPVALKVLVKQWARDPDAVARFRREARILGQLRSPFVARFVEANEAHGHHYLAMELVEGQSALGLLKEQGPLPVDAVVSIAACVARALAEVHSLGLVHRDIKPSNVLIRADSPVERPMAKLCDFGISRGTDGEEPKLTTVGTPGTPCYMAPEQVRGGTLDARTDVYAFGVMLYELLTGQPPFVGHASAVLLSHVSDEPAPIRERRPDVPEALAAIVHRALEKRPHARQDDASELVQALETVWHGAAVGEDALPQTLSLVGTPIVYDNAWELSSSPAELWPHVSNTERFNRAIGLNDVDWMSASEGGELHREGQLRSAGMLLRWKENPFEWVAPHRLGVVREYSSGPFEWLRSLVWLVPREGGGTLLHHRIEIRPRSLVGRIAAGIEVGVRMKRAMERVYRHVDESCRRTRDGQAGASFDPFENASDLGAEPARRLDEKLRALVTAGADPYIVEALGLHVRSAPAPRLARIRPREWAREHGLDEAVALEVLLRAAHEGVLAVLWDVLCPSCRIPSSIAESLKRLADHGHCEACDLDFELDLARSVELVFRVSPEIRAADLGVYCIGGPAHSPHVLAQVRLQPGQRLALSLELPEGSYRIAGRGLPSEHTFRVHPRAVLSAWELPLGLGLPKSVARSLATGQQHITLTNDLDREIVARVESASERSDAFTAADAAASALFRELFPSELLSPAQLIGVSKVALLFAESGDPSARYLEDDRDSYQGLSDLLLAVREAAELEGGALVKLHGDAVLAVFTGSAASVRAALRVMRGDVRASVHTGPAMMTTIQERLDYFGRTVQLGAAMVQQSGPGELLVSEEVQKDEVAAELLRERGRPTGVVRVGPIIATRIRCA